MHDTISSSGFNNHFIFANRIELSSISAIYLPKYFSLNRSISSIRSLAHNPESLALEHINSGKPTTSLIINKILLNQNLSVTDSKLEELLQLSPPTFCLGL